jgi:hypothetical protein
MVIYNTPTRLGCGLCGDDSVAPVLPPTENEYAVATDPSQTVIAPKTAFDTAVAIGLGVGVVALGVIAGVYAVSRRV